MDFPLGGRLHGPTITPWSRESIGLNVRATTASTVWVSANRALYVPFQLNTPWLLQALFVVNGANVAGQMDLGVYDEAATRLVSIGSTNHAGTNVLQAASVTPTLLDPGVYYMAVAFNNGATARVHRGSPGLSQCINMGMAQQASAFPLPATATFATVTSSYLPLFGLTSALVI